MYFCLGKSRSLQEKYYNAETFVEICYVYKAVLTSNGKRKICENVSVPRLFMYRTKRN